VIRPFAWVMSFGIFTGTFSFYYIAAPVLLIESAGRLRMRAARGRSVRGHRDLVCAGAAAGVRSSSPAARTVGTRQWRSLPCGSHCHLTDAAFDADRDARSPRAKAAGWTRRGNRGHRRLGERASC